MSGILVSGWTLITETEEGILVLGKKNKDLCLLNFDSLSVSDVALYWKETDNPEEVLQFFTNPFNGYEKFLIDLLKPKFEVIRVEINLETNELFIL
jgi:hypothetical protein